MWVFVDWIKTSPTPLKLNEVHFPTVRKLKLPLFKRRRDVTRRERVAGLRDKSAQNAAFSSTERPGAFLCRRAAAQGGQEKKGSGRRWNVPRPKGFDSVASSKTTQPDLYKQQEQLMPPLLTQEKKKKSQVFDLRSSERFTVTTAQRIKIEKLFSRLFMYIPYFHDHKAHCI